MSSAPEPLASPLLHTLDRMQAVLRRLGAVKDLERLYVEAVREAAGFFGATQSCLALYEPQTGMMQFQRPAIGLDETQLQALSAMSAEHIALFLHDAPEHGVVHLLAPEHAHLCAPGLIDRLDEHDVLLALMRAEGQVVGGFRLANRADGAAFTHEQTHLLGLFASQLGVLIQNLRLLANEQRARHLAETLLKVPQVVRQPRLTEGAAVRAAVPPDDADPQVLLTRLLELLNQVIAYSSASIALFEHEHLRFIAACGDTILPDLIGFSLDVSADQKVADIVSSGQPLNIPDTHGDPRWLMWEGSERIRAWIGAPIWAPGRARHERADLIGTLNIDGDQIGAFDASDVAVAQAFADQIAIVLENQRLYTNMARRAAELALVNQISTALNASLDLPAVLQSMATQLALALSVEQCGLVLFDRERRVGRIVAEYQRHPDDTAKDVLIPIQGNLSLARILETKSPLPIRDAQHDPLMANVQEAMVARGVKSILLLPLIVHGEVIGTVGLDELNAMRDFDPAEIALAQTITNQAATALENARLYQVEQERARQLTEAYDELRALDRMKDELVQTISHELRTPLTFIKGYVELLLEGMMGDLNGEQMDALKIVAQRTDNVIRMVSDIISLARLESVGLNLLPVSLAQIAQGSVQSAQAVSTQLGLALITDFPDDLPLVYGEPQRLSQVFDNLIGNAVKFSPRGGAVRVQLRAEDRFVRAEVADQGVGIPADKLSRVWERFYQVESTTSRRFSGTGLGLAIVKRIVEAHGGQVGVHSVEGQGSTFYFTVPRADVEGAVMP